RLISQRCPPGFKSFQGDPPELVEDIERWEADVSTALEPWPSYRAQFSGPVTHGDSYFWSTQEMEMRMNLLMAIVEILASRDSSLLNNLSRMSHRKRA
ncbi:MAG: hypothetical protein WA860_10525, partial [Acidimicrobiales bacterium]